MTVLELDVSETLDMNLAERPLAPDARKLAGLSDFKSIFVTYSISVAAASIAEVATYPLDLTKTRLQIQGEIAAKSHSTQASQTAPYRGMLKTGLGIVREEGLLKLWTGITPAMWRHMIYSGSRMIMYEKLRNNVFHKNPDGTFTLWKSIVSGVTAGASAQFLSSPADLVKVQMMMEGRRRLLGEKPRVKSATDALFRIYKQGGFRGLWKGSIPNVQRAALVNLGDLTTYDTAKSHLLKYTALPDSYVVHFLSSICAGFVASVVGTPADVIKTRVMNQPTDKNGRGLVYSSSYDCLKKTISNEGFLAMYKGFIPVWIRLAPWSLIFWLSYEEFRNLVGAEKF